MKDLYSKLTITESIPLAAIATDTTTNGTAISLSEHNSVVFVFFAGTLTDGAYLPGVEFSADGGSTWTDVAAADLHGALVSIALTDDDTTQKVGYKLKGGYDSSGTYVKAGGQLRATIVSSATSTGGLLGAFAILSNEKQIGGSSIIE